MKKHCILLGLFLLAGATETFAGSLSTINLTPCTFELYSGYGSIPNPTSPATPYVFGFNLVPIPPGTNNYASPDLLPGFHTDAPPQLWGTGCAGSSKVTAPNGAGFLIARTAPNTVYVSTNNPACNGGNNYTMTWNVSGGNGCDAVILVF